MFVKVTEYQDNSIVAQRRYAACYPIAPSVHPSDIECTGHGVRWITHTVLVSEKATPETLVQSVLHQLVLSQMENSSRVPTIRYGQSYYARVTFAPGHFYQVDQQVVSITARHFETGEIFVRAMTAPASHSEQLIALCLLSLDDLHQETLLARTPVTVGALHRAGSGEGLIAAQTTQFNIFVRLQK